MRRGQFHQHAEIGLTHAGLGGHVAEALFSRAGAAMIGAMESSQNGKPVFYRSFRYRTRGPVFAPRFTSRG